MGVIEWLRGVLERRRMRRKVDWKTCEREFGWSPKKAAEKAYVKMLTDHKMAIFKIQMEAQLRAFNEKMAELKEWFRISEAAARRTARGN